MWEFHWPRKGRWALQRLDLLSPGCAGTEGSKEQTLPGEALLCFMLQSIFVSMKKAYQFLLRWRTLRKHLMKQHTIMTDGGTSLAVQWLRLRAANAGGEGSIPGGRTGILHAPRGGQKMKTKALWQMCTCTRPSLVKGRSAGKESACSAGSIPRLGQSPGEGKGYPLQCSGLENPTDRTVHGVTESWTWQSNFHSLFIDSI